MLYSGAVLDVFCLEIPFKYFEISFDFYPNKLETERQTVDMNFFFVQNQNFANLISIIVIMILSKRY